MKIKRMLTLLLVLAAVFSLSSCSKGNVTELTSGGFDPSVAAAHDKDAYLDLALKLVKSAASERGKNAAVSPYSVISALAFLSECAENGSLIQIENASGYTSGKLQSELLYILSADQTDIKLSNSVFIKEGIDLDKNAYTAGARVFSATPGRNTVKFINGLCSENTGGTVKKAVESFDGTDMLILNTLLFDCAWNEIYEDKDVKTRNFKNYDGTQTEVKILCTKENIIINDEYIGFNKKYKNEKYCFTALMPKDENVDIYDFLESIDAEKWSQIYSSQKGVMVAVRFPEFSVDCGADAIRIFKDLGITDVFDKEKADLSKAFTKDLFCSDLVLSTRVEINRKGTGRQDSELFKERGTEALPDYDLIFLDRPFVFAVTDETTLSPIYIGVVANMAEAVRN